MISGNGMLPEKDSYIVYLMVFGTPINRYQSAMAGLCSKRMPKCVIPHFNLSAPRFILKVIESLSQEAM